MSNERAAGKKQKKNNVTRVPIVVTMMYIVYVYTLIRIIVNFNLNRIPHLVKMSSV